MTDWSSLSGFDRRSSGTAAQPQALDRLRRGEAPRHDLVEAAVAQGVLDPAAQALRLR